MNHTIFISRSEFERSLSHQKLLPLKIIYGALLSGILLFAAVILYFLINASPEQSDRQDILLLLTGIHGVIALTTYSAAPIIFRNRLSVTQGPDHESTIDSIFEVIVSAYIIRLALYEGTAVFGLVICLLVTVWGTFPSNPEFLLNGLTAVLFLLVTAMTFPTQGRLGRLFSQYFT